MPRPVHVTSSEYWQSDPVIPPLQISPTGLSVGAGAGSDAVGAVVAGANVSRLFGASVPPSSQLSPWKSVWHVQMPSSLTSPWSLHVDSLLYMQCVPRVQCG